MRAPALLVLAMVAVLCGAPSPVSAAGQNDLTDPGATPRSGTTITPFSFTVRYTGGFPALWVQLHVADLTLPMLLASGTPTDGTWSATSVLPEGSWSTTFDAQATHGNDPSVAGPTVSVGTVLAPSALEATVNPSHAGGPGADPADQPADGGGDASSTPAPAAPASDPPATSDGSSAAPGETPQPSDAAPAEAAPVTAAPGGEPQATGPAPTPSSPPNAVITSGSNAPAEPSDDTQGAADATEPDGWLAETPGLLELAAGIGAAAATLAVFGWFIVLVARRRRAPVAESPDNPAPPAAARTTADQIDAVLHRRTLRRARIQLDTEPIIGSDDPPPHRARGIGRRSPPT